MKRFYKAKGLKYEKRQKLFPLYTSLLSVVLCMACLAGSTWGWFTANQIVTVKSITAAEWTLTDLAVYQLADSDMDMLSETQTPVSVTVTEAGMEFTVSPNTRYLVTPTVQASATNGFLLVETCDGSFYTTDSTSGFYLLLSAGGTVKVSASWGTNCGSATAFSNGAVLGNGTIPTCTCESKCTDEIPNNDCPVCAADSAACQGAEAPQCTCTEQCVETGNKNCVVCQDGIEGCAGGATQDDQMPSSALNGSAAAESDDTDSVVPETSAPAVADETDLAASESLAAPESGEGGTDESESFDGNIN